SFGRNACRNRKRQRSCPQLHADDWRGLDRVVNKFAGSANAPGAALWSAAARPSPGPGNNINKRARAGTNQDMVSYPGAVERRRTAPSAGDAEVARGLVAGERWAVCEAWHRFAPIVLSNAERFLGSRTEAEDVVQEV